ncbi:MAG: hypothetical protein FJ319_11620 [SAR202 cluster bacterium]|nr:hypothetical protein [SAR202 cluster bacterium]
MPAMSTIRATEIKPPPAWALLQRQLIAVQEEAARQFVAKYCHPNGRIFYIQDVDDVYEIFYNWGLFYAIGGDESIWKAALKAWNATTRYFDDSTPRDHREPAHPAFRPQLHNEYYNQAGPCDWFHMGEGNMAFYDMGVADPTIAENARRAQRFAAMYMGEDPEAPNYDPKYKIIRSPFHSSVGPMFHMDLSRVKAYLDPWYRLTGQGIFGFAQRSNLHPVVKDLEEDWFEDPKRREEILKIFSEVVLDGDVADNLAATALVTNAYLYTGNERFKRWVLEYTDAWLERLRQNNGILPDNIGPHGKVGEKRGGQWWGGLYGWNSRWAGDHNFISATIAAECAVLLTGDFKYMELMRSQIKVLLDNARVEPDGQVLAPRRMTEEGWSEYEPVKILELAHVWHATLSKEDRDLMARIREGDKQRNWNDVKPEPGRRGGNLELARFQYYDGMLPDWPEKVLHAELEYAQVALAQIQADKRDLETIVKDNRFPPHNPKTPDRTAYGGENANPVRTVGLTQVTMGAPRSLYNGGLLRATVRYYDADRTRPGLPPDVSALVDALSADKVGIHLVNTSPTETRRLIVQAGAFGEHLFTDVTYQAAQRKESILNPFGYVAEKVAFKEARVKVEGKYFAVDLPPMASVRVEAGMARFVNKPSYAHPWHGDRLPLRQ